MIPHIVWNQCVLLMSIFDLNCLTEDTLVVRCIQQNLLVYGGRDTTTSLIALVLYHLSDDEDF